MKHYTLGILRHRCSNKMRIGKPVKLYESSARVRSCPNCGKRIDVQEVK
jgi:hypothetical protein